MRRCYIVVRQLFYMSNGVHHQVAEDNPVRDVFTTAEAAIKWARAYITYHIEQSPEPLHMVEVKPDSEVIYKVSSFYSSGLCDRSYCVIKEGMMV